MMQPPIDFLLCGLADRSMRRDRGRTQAWGMPCASGPVANLRLPCAVRLRAVSGAHAIHSQRRAGVLQEGASVRVEPWQRFHHDGVVARTANAGTHLALHIELCDDVARQLALGPDPALTLRLAHAVFAEPWADWSLAAAARRMGMPTTRLRASLFREGSAFTAIVREQRLMRALLSLCVHQEIHADLAQLASWTGFGTLARFEVAFFQHFGCRPVAATVLSVGAALAANAARPAARLWPPQDAA